MRVVRDADAELTAPPRRGRAAVERDRRGREQHGRQARPTTQLAALPLAPADASRTSGRSSRCATAVDGTHHGFDAVIADLPEAVAQGRGERWVEGIFGLHARHHGNGVGYDSICAAGDHANTLHWIKNTGDVHDGDLLLLDAGVEVDSLFTADITRTLPVSGTFTDAQREVYDAVYAAQEAGIAAVQAGQQVLATCTPPPSGSSPSTCTRGACCPRASTSRAPSTRSTASTTAAGWCTAPATTSASTCTTAPSPPARSTWTPCSSRAWCSPSSRASTSRPTTCSSPERVPRHRRAHRGRRGRHRRRLREPLGRDAAHVDRRRGVDRRALEPRGDPERRSTAAPRHARRHPAAGQAAGGAGVLLRLLGRGVALTAARSWPSRGRRVHLGEHLAGPLRRTCARTSTSYRVATTWLTEVKSRCAAGDGVADERPHQAEQGAEDHGRDDAAASPRLGVEAARRSGRRTGPSHTPDSSTAHGHPAAGEPAGDPLELLEVGADDEQFCTGNSWSER